MYFTDYKLKGCILSYIFLLMMSVLGQTIIIMKSAWICTSNSVLTFPLHLMADVHKSSIIFKQMGNVFLS